MPRYAKARDANEPEIVKALQSIGVQVWKHDTPMDLCCLCNQTKLFFWVEVKNPDSERNKRKTGAYRNNRTRIQEKFLDETRGALRTVVETVDDALTFVQIVVRRRNE